MAEAARIAFGPSSPGFVILLLVLVAVLSWLGELITSSLGKGQIASMIRTASLVSAILLVVGIVWQLLIKFFNLAAGKL
jgi:hypothetical protein